MEDEIVVALDLSARLEAMGYVVKPVRDRDLQTAIEAGLAASRRGKLDT